jgi:hypothetical protein
MVEPHRMAFQPADDFPQTGYPRKLPVEQGDELALGRKSPHVLVRLVFADQAIKHVPRNLLQDIVENAILVPHGVAPISRPKRRQTLEYE